MATVWSTVAASLWPSCGRHPATLAMQVIFQVFPPEKRGSAMGIYGIGVAPALGPTLGGIMVDSFSWRYVLFMPCRSALSGCSLPPLFMPGRAISGSPRKFDWMGFGLMTVFLVTLLNGLSNEQRDGWFSDSILRDFPVAFISGIGFVVWELHTPRAHAQSQALHEPGLCGRVRPGLHLRGGNLRFDLRDSAVRADDPELHADPLRPAADAGRADPGARLPDSRASHR
ncbi:MFS transporter [Nisaea sp.]|uniref:MFS transporter n=1 Tax=Nisaea sp. TaxID=2024842 RepID=UPI003B523FCC